MKKRILFLFAACTCILLQGCKESPESVVKSYLGASSLKERMAYCVQHKQLKANMKKHYGRTSIKPLRYLSMESHKPKNRPTIRITTALEENNLGQKTQYYANYNVVKTKSGYKIDWESSVGFNSLSWAELKSTRPSKTVTLRVYAKLNTLGLGFIKKEHFHKINLYDPSGRSLYIDGYVYKHLQVGKRMFQKLKDGRKHPFLLKGQYKELPANTIAGVSVQKEMLITEVVSNHWYNTQVR